ncbi:hypothetical protein B4N84_04440 [Flavobacterium sp. IR1]|nr:hypothetical protein B4N84_04440 [Flavobacterium sp. IR1]
MHKLGVLIFALTFLSCANLRDPSFIEILENAQHDIKVDSVKYFTNRLPFIRPVFAQSTIDTMSKTTREGIEKMDEILNRSQVERELRKNIMTRYGLYEHNLGCMVDKQTSILAKEYKRVTAFYLEKRNGKNWEENMQEEMINISND